MSSSQVGYLVTANIITAFGGGILYGLYQLAGDYLTTFFFMIIFAVTLASIRISVVNYIEKLYATNSERWLSQRIYLSHQAKFGITFNLILNVVYCLRHPFIENLFNFHLIIIEYLKELFTTSSIPYVFVFYVIVIKLQCLPQVLFWDVLFWAVIDLLRIISYPMKKKGLLEWISKPKLLNTILFASVLLGIILLIPISIALIYQDIMIYKEDLIPKLQSYEIPNEYKYYLSADFLLSQLQGQYLTESQIQQLSAYLHPVDVEDNHQNKVIFLEIFYGEHAMKILRGIKDCQDSKYCQAKVLFNNLDLLNDQIYEYMQYGYNYFNAIWPQLQQFAQVIMQFLMKWECSISSEIHHILIGSDVLQQQFIIEQIVIFGMSYNQKQQYLLTESSFYDLVSVKEKKNSFKGTLVQNISKHITGVFVSLFTIFMYKRMVEILIITLYVILYVFGYLTNKLAFIQSLLIGLLSLSQIVDPGVTFIMITGVWWLAGFFNDVVHEFCINDGLTILLAIGFYFSSGSIYLNTFKQQLGDAYWSAMSVILGYISFKWLGLLIGPLLIGGVRTLYEVLAWYWGEREIVDDQKRIQNENQQIQSDSKTTIENKGNTKKNNQSKKEGKKKKD